MSRSEAVRGAHGRPPDTRAMLQPVRDRTRKWQRLEKLLEDAPVKLSSVVSGLARTKTARDILEALADGHSDPKALAALAAGQIKGGREAVEHALEGMLPASTIPCSSGSTSTTSPSWTVPSLR